MTVRAPGIERVRCAVDRTNARLRAGRRGAEEYALFKVFAGNHTRSKLLQFFARELALFGGSRDAGAGGEVRILLWQAVKKGGDEFGVAVRQR